MNNRTFNNSQVKKVSYFLQGYMLVNGIEMMRPDECADLLYEYGLLDKYDPEHPAKGFNFRQMLRDGRDGIIDLVIGAEQEKPRANWYIKRIK